MPAPASIMAQPGLPAASLVAAVVTGAANATIVVLPNYAGVGMPRKFAWNVSAPGTPPATFTVALEASDDNVTWSQIDTTSALGRKDIVDKTPRFLRANVTAITTPGGGLTITVEI